MHDSDEFHYFVISSFGNRLRCLIMLVEHAALESIEQRLATFLLDRTAIDHQVLEATHQDNATEIGTAREVVSRQVKSLAERRVASLARGSITVLDRSALEESMEGR